MKNIIFCSFLCISLLGFAQENVTYQVPPDEILELADAPTTPTLRMDSQGETIVFLYSNRFKSIAELSEKELRLGGLRINPITNIGSRMRYYSELKVRNGRFGDEIAVKGIPDNARIANFSFSPDEKLAAFTNTTTEGVELWLLDLKTANARPVTRAVLNGNSGQPYIWFKDSGSLLAKFLSSDRKDLINTQTAVPTGPTVSVSEMGVKAQNRTYQDLLKSPADEHNFEQLLLSQLYVVNLDGSSRLWKNTAMYRGMSFSPDGNYILITEIHKPFSYLVTYYRFPTSTTIYKANGAYVDEILKVDLIENLPKGFGATRMGKRNLSWRSDKPATLYWCEALDGGDPAMEVKFRDQIYQLEAPFTGDKKALIKTKGRFRSVIWGNDEIAVATDRWQKTRMVRSYIFNPEATNESPVIFSERNYQDRYSDPGEFVTVRNAFGNQSLEIIGNKAFLIGDGYSAKGKFPFIDELNLKTLKTKRLYQSTYSDKLEDIQGAISMKNKEILVRLEAKNEYPNHYIRTIGGKEKLVPLTSFDNPFKSIQDVHKEVVHYKRDDGLPLSGMLYLPTNYVKGEKYPMIMWAYPREFKDRKSAGQSTANSNAFTNPSYGSVLFWVTRGYVVLNNAAFPIIGEGDTEPNDSFRKQLIANAKAGIDAVDKMGYIDRDRVAVGGHSYGAFMTANLLAHSNLFAAGIARSGAYNRTLTPFGFQNEARSYWEAPHIYYEMSPFMHAEKMKTPLLLIHGEADNNSGTYPMQSIRYFNALKGHGAPVRLVMLPKESHGYRSKESILHMLWEQDQWLEKHVKNKTKNQIRKAKDQTELKQ